MLWTSTLEIGSWDQSSVGERSGWIQEAVVGVRITGWMWHGEAGLKELWAQVQTIQGQAWWALLQLS